MAEKQFPLSLIIRAVDKATGPLRQINARLERATAPARAFGKELKTFGDLSGLNRLGGAVKGVGKAINSVGREAFALGAKFAGMAAAAGLAMFAIVKGAVNAGDDLATMAQRVGLGVDAYAQLSFAAAQADVEQAEFNTAMDQFNKRLGEAKAGTGGLLSFLKRVSPALANQLMTAKSTEEAFGLMTRAMEKIPDSGRRAALSAAAFGKSGLQMGQFMGQGTKAIDEQRRKFFALSGSQEEFAKGAGDLDNAMRETEIAFLGLRNAAAGALFPALTQLAQALSGVLAGNRERLAAWAREAGAALLSWVQGGGLDRLVAGLKETASTVIRVIDALGGMKAVGVGVAAFMAGPFVASVVSLVSSIVSLTAALGGVGGGGAFAAMAAFLAPAAAVVAALGAVGAAIFQVHKHWDDLKLNLGEFATDPMEFFGRNLSFLKDSLFGEDDRPAVGAERAKPVVRNTEARVSVDFNNVPRGTRVTPDPKSTAPVDLSVGPAMAVP